MSNRKTISINPNLFNIKKNKTVRNKKKSNHNEPLIQTTNSFKNKILKRIQQHKQKEILKKQQLTKLCKTNKKIQYNNHLNNDNNNELNELDESIEYLETLKKQSTLCNHNHNNNNHNQTVKKPSSSDINVNIDLPEEFTEFKSPLVTSKVLNDVPYGILKSGNKPTYRQYFNKTLKNKINTEPERQTQTQSQPQSQTQTHNMGVIPTTNSASNIKINSTNDIFGNNDLEEPQSIKERTTKKTTKKIYTLGKNKKKRKIGILIKNKKTQKNISSAHRDLSKTPIHEIKKFLHKRNLIKAGTGTPHDICRRMYSAVKMSGEIRNVNSDAMLHNLQKSSDDD